MNVTSKDVDDIHGWRQHSWMNITFMVGMSTMVPWLETTFMDERYFQGWKGNHWSMVGMSTMVPWLETLFIDENTIHGGNGLVWHQRFMVGNDFHGWGWLVWETSELVFTFCM